MYSFIRSNICYLFNNFVESIRYRVICGLFVSMSNNINNRWLARISGLKWRRGGALAFVRILCDILIFNLGDTSIPAEQVVLSSLVDPARFNFIRNISRFFLHLTNFFFFLSLLFKVYDYAKFTRIRQLRLKSPVKKKILI